MYETDNAEPICVPTHAGVAEIIVAQSAAPEQTTYELVEERFICDALLHSDIDEEFDSKRKQSEKTTPQPFEDPAHLSVP